MKKALLIISFGSSVKTARESIENIEKYISTKYDDYDLFRSFTSRIIIKKLNNKEGMKIEVPTEALNRIYDMGYTEVACQSLHVINGIEYEKTLSEIVEFKDKFDIITLGKPLLTSEEDYQITAQALKNQYENKEAVLFMGHGTEHYANASYSMLENMFGYINFDKAIVATVEGFPEIDYAIRKLKNMRIKRVTLVPFMVVAGDHALNDMAGNEEDSWKNILKSEGFDVEIVLEGLGNFDFIANLFYDHSKTNNEI